MRNSQKTRHPERRSTHISIRPRHPDPHILQSRAAVPQQRQHIRASEHHALNRPGLPSLRPRVLVTNFEHLERLPQMLQQLPRALVRSRVHDADAVQHFERLERPLPDQKAAGGAQIRMLMRTAPDAAGVEPEPESTDLG